MTDKSCDNKSNSQYTWQEVAEHNHVNSAWVIHNRRVYDVTSKCIFCCEKFKKPNVNSTHFFIEWVDKHPGGKEMLLINAGRDITNALLSYHPFSELPAKVITKYEIGTLIGDSEFPEYAKDSGFYEECRQQVGEYFQKRKLDPKDGFPGLWRMCLVFLVATVSFFIMNGYFQSTNFMLPMIMAGIVFGVCQAL